MTRRWIGGFISALVALGAVPQTAEQEDQFENRYHWRTTGRVASEVEMASWKDRIDNLQWSDGDLCNSTRMGVSMVMTWPRAQFGVGFRSGGRRFTLGN